MKVGDLLENNYTSEDNPLHVTLVYKITRSAIHTMYNYKNKVGYCEYAATDVKNKTEVFNIVGHTDIFSQLPTVIFKGGTKC